MHNINPVLTVFIDVPDAISIIDFGDITFSSYSCEVPVTWQPPESHGEPIDYYQISVTNDNKTTTMATTFTSFVASNIKPGSIIYFSIAAHNSVGLGALINISVSFLNISIFHPFFLFSLIHIETVAIALPPTPLAPTATEVILNDLQASFNVSWIPANPLLDGNITISYTIYRSSYPVSESPTSASLDVFEYILAQQSSYNQVFQVPVLAEGMVYEFAVSAQNVLGSSPLSPTILVKVIILFQMKILVLVKKFPSYVPGCAVDPPLDLPLKRIRGRVGWGGRRRRDLLTSFIRFLVKSSVH